MAVTNSLNTGAKIVLGGTLTTGGAVTFSGGFTFTGTLTGNTSVTFPTSGTLATTGGAVIPSVAQGDLLYGSDTNVLSALAKNTSATRYLANTGTDNNPNWDFVNVGNGVTGVLLLANGGTSKALVADNGGLVYSDADSLEILAATATANQIPMSGSNAAPSWSTATYPATTTISQLLYSSAANTIAGLATSNYGFVTTSSTGVPSVAQTYSNIRTISQVTHGFSVAHVLYLNSTTYTLADADSTNTADVVGMVVAVIDVNTFVLQFGGHITGLSGLTAGNAYYLSASAGGITDVKPSSSGQVVKPLLIADTTTSGYWTNQLGVVL